MQIIFLLLGIVTISNIFLMFIVIFRDGREASSSWAWLLAVLFIVFVVQLVDKVVIEQKSAELSDKLDCHPPPM